MITDNQYMQFLEKLDEDTTQVYDPVTEPVCNDDGRIGKALKAILTCGDKDLSSVRKQLLQGYCAYWNINNTLNDDDVSIADLFNKTPMTATQRAYDDAGVRESDFV